MVFFPQQGFIRKRQTQDSNRRTLHIIRHITQHGIEAALINLDTEKAFDSVRWTFLYEVLSKFGFHKSIIATFQALYDKLMVTYQNPSSWSVGPGRPPASSLPFLLSHWANGSDKMFTLKEYGNWWALTCLVCWWCTGILSTAHSDITEIDGYIKGIWNTFRL